MPKTPKTDATPAPTKAKQPTPCERAQASQTRVVAAQAQANSVLESVKITGDEESIALVADLVAEIDAHVTAMNLAATIACNGDVPYARRLTASGRAKQAADSAEQAASELKTAGEQAQIDADAARLEVLENSPGYTKNAEWLEIQERIAARRF